MKNNNIKGSLILLLVALIWGLAFVAQSSGMEYIGPFTFNCLRSLLAAGALYIYILIRDRKVKEKKVEDKKTLYIAGVLSGLALFVATSLQQVGIGYTTAGKAGFITSLYIIFVPIMGLVLHKKVGLNIWISVVIAIVGFYILCMNESLSLGKGELLILLCSIFFALQIMVIDKYTNLVDGIKMSCIQFLVTGILSIFFMIFEKPQISQIVLVIPSILYLGLISSGVGYTLQIIGQKQVAPTAASLILSLESVFSIIFGTIILKQIPTGRELIGCLLIFGAVVFSQIDFKKKVK